MKKILLIESSPRMHDSISRKVSNELIEKLKKKHSGAEVLKRDLAEKPLPHVTGEMVNAYFTPAEKLTTAMKETIAASDAAVDELISTDILVISAPMWNFNVPSSLKAWIDHIVRAGKTFSFGPNGLNSLVQGKKAYLVLSSGSRFSDGPLKMMDFQEPYLKAVLGFIGITDVDVLRIEGTNDPTVSSKALEQTQAKLKEI